ncbi:MAG: transposase [Chloroflexota bacterium]
MMTTPTILGIDVAKETVEVFLAVEPARRGHFGNDESGFAQLSRWLQKQGVAQVWACLEATGAYGEALALYLHEQGHWVSVVNPARIKKYGESKLSRNKTDRLDAALIADFCSSQKPGRWSPPPPEVRHLQALTRRLDDLRADHVREQNRLQAGGHATVVRCSIESHLAFLSQQIAQLEQEMQAHVNQHPPLQADQALLLSIPGIGVKTAAYLLAELPDIRRFSQSAQAVAFAGLSPHRRESGATIRQRAHLTPIGQPRLKAALYWPAITAMRFNPLIRALAERLAQRGKEKMVIVGAAMRKLLQLAYGVLKSRRPFDPHYAAVKVQLTP